MAYYHVIAKVGSDDKFRSLFSDLSEEAIREKFIKPYEKGASFFSNHDLISAAELKSIKIILTERTDDVERAEINRNERAHIDELNRSSSAIFIASFGGGYQPEDIADAGKDVTHDLIKGPPGYKAVKWTHSRGALAWVLGIIASVLAAGLIKLLGWV